ncbi:glucose-6-phosphate dehydrogenase [Schumannella luteola]|uniref:Glucose-6-phosphate 1-dehydrogenase n=1 Tax=Schumannella luteola TaxID=472059 RepID=A0A852YGT2_9MICO|nr:glucose-6-phosphate dehydrogenase [Schumannella luteola]NYH00501.1 glucose-6-phosphate 1-dehydrogenase [Schumannella luteola]TPX06242.1 glucose-6-phosphate dehydrogenase [Schumannella luteola]
MASTPPIDTLIVLGAGGDLASRLLLPGLASLLDSSRGRDLTLIGVDRAELDDATWQKRVATAFGADAGPRATRIAKSSRYLVGDATSADDLSRALAAATGRTALYFALPPAVAEKACAALRDVDRPAGLVLALEKPFASDYASARRLNRLLETLVPEEQVFRVDHFLGKSTVLNLIGLRFANRLLEPLLSSQNIERVDIVADEALGLEGRAGYYDRAGAARDMIQSHLLLVLALAAMEPPSSVESEDLRGAMAQVLRATRPWKADGTASRRGRYTAGRIDGRDLPDYSDEAGVVAARRTETLAELTVAIDTWRWAGVPFTLRSGKALGTGRQEVVFTLRDVPHLPNGLSGPKRTARIRVGIKPAVLELDLATNGHDDPFDLEWETLRTEFPANELSAYGEVLAELIEGDPTLSVRGDVAEQCWRIVGPVLDAWSRNEVPLQSYAAGSAGPRGWDKPIV